VAEIILSTILIVVGMTAIVLLVNAIENKVDYEDLEYFDDEEF
jgi:hypothetical protein